MANSGVSILVDVGGVDHDALLVLVVGLAVLLRTPLPISATTPPSTMEART